MRQFCRMPVVAGLILGIVVLSMALRTAEAYVEIPYSIGRVILEATQIVVLRVDKVDKEKNLIIFSKVQDLKGPPAPAVIKHNIGRAGFHPREWQTTMAWAEPGQIALFFNNGGASETCINNYWYQAYAGGEWWNMSHAEPYLLRSFAGRPEKLAPMVTAILGGQEVVVPAMVDGDKNSLQLRTGKIQRLKASLKIQDYDPKRDFVGWGGEDFRRIAGMPAFSHYASLTRCDPEAAGISTADFDGDGKPDLCLSGGGRMSLVQNGGSSLNEVSVGHLGGAREAGWADYNGDGKPDLLLAAPQGPKLFTNLGEGKFGDDSPGLPKEPYYHLSAATWIDYDSDKRPDILVANGVFGLRLYRNLGQSAVAAVDPIPQLEKWTYCGPFDNTGLRHFETAYPPETSGDLGLRFEGKGGDKIGWKEGNFPDKQINQLKFFKPEHNTYSIIYLQRDIDCPAAVELPISLGSDDGLGVWLNGEKILAENVARTCAPDQSRVKLKLKAGKNRLLLKVCQGDGEWAFYFNPGPHEKLAVPLFEDVTDKVGLSAPAVAGDLKGDHLAVADVNGDGRSDVLYSAGQGLLLLNTPQGFVAARDCGIRFAAAKIVPVFGDFDGDKHLDLFVPQEGQCKLFKNDGRGKFTDVTARSGALAQPLGKVTCAVGADFSGSGRLDLFLGCLQGTNRYLRNEGDGKFVDATRDIGLHQRVFNTRGISVLDLNKDGSLDVVFNNEGQESSVLLGKSGEEVAQAAEQP